jgi:hypothetical protein
MTDHTAADRAALRDRIAEAARTVRLRLGPNAIAMAQRGEPIILNLNEADDLADAVLAVLPAPTDRAAEERLARVCEWVTSDVVTARTGFGDGYREAQRDIRDLLDGRRMADEAQPVEARRLPDCPDDCPCRRVCIGRTHQPAAGAQQDGARP